MIKKIIQKFITIKFKSYLKNSLKNIEKYNEWILKKNILLKYYIYIILNK